MFRRAFEAVRSLRGRKESAVRPAEGQFSSICPGSEAPLPQGKPSTRWKLRSGDDGMPAWYRLASEKAEARIELRESERSCGGKPRSRSAAGGSCAARRDPWQSNRPGVSSDGGNAMALLPNHSACGGSRAPPLFSSCRSTEVGLQSWASCRSNDEGMPEWYRRRYDQAKAHIELKESERSSGDKHRSRSAAGGSRAAAKARTALLPDELWACRSSDEGMPEWYRWASEEAKARIEFRMSERNG